MAHNVTPNRTCRIMTIEVAVPACADDSAIADAMSALLTEDGICSPDGILLDWRYLKDQEYIAVASDDPEEGEIFEQPRKKVEGLE